MDHLCKKEKKYLKNYFIICNKIYQQLYSINIKKKLRLQRHMDRILVTCYCIEV